MLSKPQKQVLKAFLKDDASYRAIAEKRGSSINAVVQIIKRLEAKGFLKPVYIHKNFEVTPAGMKALSPSQDD